MRSFFDFLAFVADSFHSGAQQAILDAGGGQIVHVSFSPDGRWLSCVRADGSLHVYDSQANFATVCIPKNQCVCVVALLRCPVGAHGFVFADARA